MALLILNGSLVVGVGALGAGATICFGLGVGLMVTGSAVIGLTLISLLKGRT